LEQKDEHHKKNVKMENQELSTKHVIATRGRVYEWKRIRVLRPSSCLGKVEEEKGSWNILMHCMAMLLHECYRSLVFKKSLGDNKYGNVCQVKDNR
jgi:hypothetical protein